MKQHLDTLIETLCLEDPRYHEDAYDFVLEALSFTQHKFRRRKHVTGKELLEGVKILLMERFGVMALSVLQYWGIKATEDFGNIVFNLIQKKILSKTEEDSLEDFRDVYDLETILGPVYRRAVEKKISQLRY